MGVDRFLGWASWLVLGYGGFCLLMLLTQRSFIYFPRPAADPSGRLELSVEGKRVLVAHRAHPGPRGLIYFGGNAEDVSLTRAELAVLLPDTAIYLLHYRGYGGSEGSPSEVALRADTRALYALVAERHSEVTVVGRSLGAGPAVHLAATRQVHRLVLLVPFDSLLAVARGAMPWLPMNLLLIDRWDAAAEAPLVRAPTTIVAAVFDRVVPARHAEALHHAFLPGVAELLLVSDLDHNTPILDSAAFRAALQGTAPGCRSSESGGC
ncbi:alpha/beta hydrolase [Synechococcus sp. Cruz-9H2]|uniref:alpha/beta hydrolase n=1 Tax=unclassified Synechococcus TaxID=2626047 RepID=UPI0020CDA928|nr:MULTISPECIES: alpha/beta hydrolase [unclassified Synechococcus]MCP9820961.1 alpha/beta hydrolase [Synechococcus sp. Cruz-9H2]MCP9845196.1 alpha/beta hydrolase [Synechococcus sp. Edmonson 11F2]MCP9857367.1 alpha/beta hydrolase [Synechococcus sp. Cruz-9C9]MCP9864612.1 alpha/beta hydrolase [Synechococcus sp. Cruz-7E5]MCP9871882.1 alpha/beta hydrolase [Synechococcus sp. Cruz-7B9]